MKYVLAVLLLMVAGCGEARTTERAVYDAADAVSLRLERDNGNGTVRVCSGWVLAHHAIVTDEHCIDDGLKGWAVDGRRVRFAGAMLDHNDHAILITDLYFRDVAKMGPLPQRGDEVFTLGNPDGQSDILLRSHVAGFKPEYVVDGWGTFHDLILLDSNDTHGCSGAAVFDAQGRVVGVIDALWPFPNDGWKLSAAFGLRFTPMQYLIAANASPQENWLVGTAPSGFVTH